MLTKDPLLTYIAGMRFPLRSGKEELKEFLECELDKYNVNLSKLLVSENRTLSGDFYENLESLIIFIRLVSNNIIKVLIEYDKANYLEANKLAIETMNEIASKITFVNMMSSNVYYRIRGVNSKEKQIDRKGLFHVPFHLRKHIDSSRYSLHGMPSLYLGTLPALCWYESRMPKRFRASSFRLCENKKLNLLDLSIFPFTLASAIDLDLVNKKIERMELNESKLLEFLVLLPIRIACSISVEEKGKTFVHEYVFPQLVLSWVRNHSEFDGIRYQSASETVEAHEWNAYNVVLPIKSHNDEGICEELANLFEISEPNYYSIKEFFGNNDSAEKVKDMHNQVYNWYRNEKVYGLFELEQILFSVVTLIDEVISEQHESNLSLIRALDGLYLGFSSYVSDEKSFIDKIEKDNRPSNNISHDEMKKYYKILNDFKVHTLSTYYRAGFLRIYDFDNYKKIV